jgi:hypothetical protein
MTIPPPRDSGKPEYAGGIGNRELVWTILIVVVVFLIPTLIKIFG